MGATLVFYRVDLRMVAQALQEHALHVFQWSALLSLGKLLADKGVESHAAGAEIGMVVHHAVVEVVHVAGVDDVYRLLDVDGNGEVTGQAVAGATGEQGHDGVGMEQSAAHLVDGAVAPYRHHHVVALIACVAGYLRGVTGTLGIHYFIVILILVNIRINQFCYPRFLYRTRNRVHHKQSLHGVTFFVILLFSSFKLE